MGPDGRLIVADLFNDSIRCVGRDGNVSTVAGRPCERGREESIDGDVAVARFNHPCAVAVASDGTIYVGEREGQRVRQISREGIVSTVCECEGAVSGLFLDEGLLYVAAGNRILSIVVPTRAARLQQKYAHLAPILRVWSLMQREARAEMVPAAAQASVDEIRAREALRLLMKCSIIDILQRVLLFAYA